MIAVRPENVILTKEDSSMKGTIRTIMVLGHYGEVSIDYNDQIIKAYINKSEVGNYTPHEQVSMKFAEKFIYAA